MPKTDLEKKESAEKTENALSAHEKPLDPTVERVRRKLMWFMIISTTITFLLVFAVIIAVIYKVMQPTPVKTAPPTLQSQSISQNNLAALKNIENAVILPQGAKLISQSLSGEQISLEVLGADGKTTLIIYDWRQAKEIARIAMTVPGE